MRLTTPSLCEKDKLSFDEHDKLKRRPFGEALLNLVTNSNEQLVILLDGKWGEGKTTFVKMWQDLLDEKRIPNIYIDAFFNDYIDDPFALIAGAILSYAKQNVVNNTSSFFDEFIEKTVSLQSWSKRTLVKFFLGRFIPESSIDELLEINKRSASKDVIGTAQDVVEKELSDCNNYIDTVELFKGALGELLKMLKENKKELSNDKRNELSDDSKVDPLCEDETKALKEDETKPLVVVIDELDRCKPPFALQTLEKIKHFFSVDRVLFVLVMNKEELEKTVKGVYGLDDEGARVYLQKFINIEFHLPKRIGGYDDNDLRLYCKELIKLHEFMNQRDDDHIIADLTALANHYNLSLRQVERVFTNIVLYYMVTTDSQIRVVSIIVFLSVIKVIKPELFIRLLNQSIFWDEFINKSGLIGIDEKKLTKRAAETLIPYLHWGLLPEEVATSLNSNQLSEYNNIEINKYSVDRTDLIKIHAQGLSLFG